ncbi:FtsX-like permease family protein [Fulvivirga sp. M361]|uniref:ABC transporter permease n=1 Tax=Fulvivirga sp. M361 TaxID=2594266 RepID=UPI00117BBAC9|nr:ABC transporter permease [Fulvivirga sp. M361]TRX60086.1 FtsX-like permease family protein [Fulvivirga sp. M361]
MCRKTDIPKIPHALFKWYCRPERYEELHGDLEEFFYERVDEYGATKARLYYLLDVIRCCQSYAWKKTGRQTNLTISMFRNFYFTAIRNLIKNKGYSSINIAGLTIGMTSFIFISLFIVNELSYDRFHSDYKNIYRARSEGQIRAQRVDNATTPSPMAKTLLNTYPEVVKVTRVRKSDPLLVEKGSSKINEEGILYADSTFFDVFDFNLVEGDPATALVHPRSMLLTETYAKKYFGEEEPIGKHLSIEKDTILYTITGVLEDVPANSHIQFNMLCSMSSNASWDNDRWVDGLFYTYVILADKVNVEALEEKMQDLVYQYLAPEIEYYTELTMAEWEGSGNHVTYSLFPVKDIHLYSKSIREIGVNGNISYIYIYSVIALIIVFIAIFNFINLATAQSTSRAREVGVRKVMGSTKTGLIYQFIFESVIVSSISTILAAILVTVFMPSFIHLVGKPLTFGLTSSYIGLLALFGLTIVVGVLAGSYPAFVLATSKPVDALKGASRSGSRVGWLRNFLVIIQFAASIVIIIGTLVVYYQIDFMLTKNLGFDKERTLVIRRPDALANNLEAFKNELLLDPAISAVVNSKTIPGKNYAIRSYRRKDRSETHIFKNNQVGFGYEAVMGLELISGRYFSQEYSSDSNAVIINESAARSLGFEDPIGQNLTSSFRRGELLEIIGVVKDYNIESLHRPIEPTSLELRPTTTKGYISVKMTSDLNVRETIQYIEKAWHTHSDKPLQYFFFDEDYENLYRSESATGKVFVVFAALSIFIACLGLIGLIAYTIAVRKKEIGIRKVLGANTGILIRLLSSEIVRLIIIATLVSWPLAYFATDYWLQNFADRLDIDLWIYAVPTLIVLLIGCLAISFQTIRASLSNPIHALKEE